jgi:hypothetical protein
VTDVVPVVGNVEAGRYASKVQRSVRCEGGYNRTIGEQQTVSSKQAPFRAR